MFTSNDFSDPGCLAVRAARVSHSLSAAVADSLKMLTSLDLSFCGATFTRTELLEIFKQWYEIYSIYILQQKNIPIA